MSISHNVHPGTNDTPAVSPGNYSPVTVTITEVVGVIFLGILSILLWIGWQRAESRYRALLNELLEQDLYSA